MSAQLVHLTEDRVRQLLDWPSVVDAVERSMIAVSTNRAVQTPRTFTRVLEKDDILLCMPGYLKIENSATLACKMVTAFPNNEKLKPALSSILANIFLFNENTGKLKAIIEATEITAWRTAAASVVATKYLHCQLHTRKNEILAILGAGTQGRIHAIAFNDFFKYKMIKIWNHRSEKAVKLAEELNYLGIKVISCPTAQECVENADVIITATYAAKPIVNLEWVKSNVHINAVGAGTSHHSELSESIYLQSQIYVDHMKSAKIELCGLEKELKVPLIAEVGDVITKNVLAPNAEKITIFHSLGMAVEDAAVGQLIYDKYMAQTVA